MAKINFYVQNTTSSQDIGFMLDGVTEDITDAEAIQIAELIKGSDFVARLLGTSNIVLEDNMNIFTARIIDPNA